MARGKTDPKVSMLQLLKLCRKHSTQPEGVKIIANELAVTTRFVYNKIDEYCIIPNLTNKDMEV